MPSRREPEEASCSGVARGLDRAAIDAERELRAEGQHSTAQCSEAVGELLLGSYGYRYAGRLVLVWRGDAWRQLRPKRAAMCMIPDSPLFISPASANLQAPQ